MAAESNRISRRTLLQGCLATGVGTVLGACASGMSPAAADRRCILLVLAGGPSHIDTWDPKPSAPAEIRGPFSSIPTTVPGVRICELFPGIARRCHRLAIIRSVFLEGPPLHEVGLQCLQTGEFDYRSPRPHVASAVAWHSASPAGVVIPARLQSLQVDCDTGQCDPALCEYRLDHLASQIGDDRHVMRYGDSSIGRSCRYAVRLLERGVRFVTVNVAGSGIDSWDCHAERPPLDAKPDDYRSYIGPAFDVAFSAMLDDLERTGLLEDTLVVAAGEFGRSPRLNNRGGRDHWGSVFSILMAGGDVPAGAVIGASDRTGSEPAANPIPLAQVPATILAHFGLDPLQAIESGPIAWS